MKPTKPETGFGYIEAGEDLHGAYKQVLLENQDLETAEAYLAKRKLLLEFRVVCFSGGCVSK